MHDQFPEPDGRDHARAKKQELVELLRRHQVPLIEDDVYAELYYGQQAPKPAKAFDTEGWVMHCGSFAKSLAPGYRIGWVAAGRFAQKIERLKPATSLCASMPAQAAIADYLQHGGYDRHLRKLRYALEEQQSAMLAAIARYSAQTRVSQPAGRLLLVAGIAAADGFAEIVPDGLGARHQHRAGAYLFAGATVQELYSAELWQPLG